MQNYVSPGKRIDIAAAPYALASGAGCLVGNIFGVAADTAAIGADVVLVVEGVFTLPKVPALAVAVGDPLYWDNTAMNVTETAAGNTLIGVAVTAAPDPSPTVNVRLNGSFG